MATIKQNILLLAMAFAGLWGTAQAQTLSVNPITVDAGAQTELCVNIEGATSITALQFNLAIPEGFAFKQNDGNYGIELGAATAGHTLSVSELSSGELLVVLYNMNLNTFKDGTLLTLPLVAGAEAGTSNGALSKVRMATTAAESNALDNVNFSFQISETTLSVNPITVDAEAQTELCVNIEGATNMTALQFNLAIPEGFAFKQNDGNYGIELGAATAGHTLSVSELKSGELLVVLYNMNLNTFKDGTLLTLPLVAGAEAGTSNGALSKVRMATTTAVSGALDSVNFSFQISAPAGISGVTTPSTLSNTYYDLQGRKVAQPTRGIYIFNGKKVIK